VLWAVVAAVGIGVSLLHRRLLHESDRATPWAKNRIVGFVGALVVTVVAMGWPLGDLAAHWSLMALVLQRCVLVLAVAPLLLAGLPDDVIAWSTRPAAVDATLMRITRPPAAVVCVTVLLVGSMAPVLVAAQSQSPLARGALAVVVLVAGVVLWLPIIGRVPGIPRPRPMIRAVYLVAQAVVPVFLSFIFILATRPLYPQFARSKDVIGLRPLNDQQVSGFVSKLTFLATLLVVAAVILARAPDSDDDLGPEDPLVWADIERHFERADRRRHPIADPGVPPAPETPEVPAGPEGPEGSPPTGDLAAHPPGDLDPGPDQDPTTG
jgi:putative membrane protein